MTWLARDRAQARRCATRAGPRAARRASCIRIARRSCTRSSPPCPTRSGSSRDGSCRRVPMFHVNGWNLPFMAALTGAELVLPGPSARSAACWTCSTASASHSRPGCRRCGWPSQAVDAEPDRWDLRSLEQVNLGGAAVPVSLIAGFDRHGMTIVQGWGMTETSPLGTLSRLPAGPREARPRDQRDIALVRGRRSRSSRSVPGMSDGA